LSQAFDRRTIDDVLFLRDVYEADMKEWSYVCTGDGVSRFTQLYAASLAKFTLFHAQRGFGGYANHYRVEITEKGRRLLDAWSAGNASALSEIVALPADEASSGRDGSSHHGGSGAPILANQDADR
jgi:hypothetical protein